MEQHPIRVSFPVGTKLLISVVSLLFIVIIFLNLSSIFLFREDKRAYIYQSQSTESLLVGKQFLVTANHSLDTLRTSLAAIDPKKPITPAQTVSLQSILDNQTEVIKASIYFVNLLTGAKTSYADVSKSNQQDHREIRTEDYVISQEWFKFLIPDLLKNGYAFMNLSQMGGAPILGVILADTKLKDNSMGMPVCVGLVSLQDFANDLKNIQLTIATRTGSVLYDTDPSQFFSSENISEHPLFKAAVSSSLMNGAQEFDSNGNHFLGSYVLPGLNLVVITRTEWQQAIKATYVLIEKFVLFGSMAIGAAIIFAILFSKTLTAPIDRLYEATREVSAGNFEVHLEEKSSDELGALSQSFNSMSTKIGELIQESIKKVQLENELAIASTVQQTLIPPSEFKNQWMDLYSHYQAASQCGGDWWGFFGVGKKTALMIADATGHGLPCALMTASARSCFSFMHKLAQEDPEFSFSPSAMLSFANRIVYDASLGKIMMTFFICVLDFETNTLSYSSAGHNSPWLFVKNGESFQLKSLVVPGQRLGEGSSAPEFEEKSTPIHPGDIIFMYTDGLTEGKNLQGEQYGKKRARAQIESQLSHGPEQVIKGLMADFMLYQGEKELDDDVTIAAIQIKIGEDTVSPHA